VPLISLIGLPGGGKTSTGRQLARRLNQPFEDSDAVIERQLGESIRSFFEREGEARFRDVEEEVIRDLTLNFSGVLATGGGAVLRPANRVQLREHSTVIYLTATPESLMRRLRFDAKRPLLQTSDPLGRLQELHAQRDPLYRETAHFQIATGRPPVSVLVTMILTQLELAGVVDPYTVPSVVDPSTPAPMQSPQVPTP
jgi:shikimate kinase